MREIFRFTRGKIFAAMILAVVLIITGYLIPSSGVAARLGASPVWVRITSLILSLAVSAIIYYPLICGFWTVGRRVKGNREIKSGQIIVSIVLILVFNPFTLSLIYSSLTAKRLPTPTPCAWGVAKFAKYSKAYDNGLRAGDMIKTINGKSAKTLSIINAEALAKKIGEKIEIITDRGTYQIEVVENPQTKKGTLGLLLAPVNCPKK